MGRWVQLAPFLAAFLLAGGGPVAAASDRGAVLEELAQVREACRRAERPGRRRLYVLRVPEVSFGEHRADEGFLPIDTRRNLRALDGAVELFPSQLEPMGFEVDAERAAALRRVVRSGARLRVGFFLGFDNRHRSACLIRSAFGVTTVRMDLAFVELLDRRGKLLARQTTDRLRAWMDDLERTRIPGEGPRAALRGGTLSAGAGALPDSWSRALEAHGTTATQAAGRCHARAVREGAPGEGKVVVRATIEPGAGRVRETAVALSTVERPEARCIARALADHLRLPPAPELGQDPVRVSVTVQLAD